MDNKKVQDFVNKATDIKNKELDLSSGEDLSIAIMNLVSIEEHFFFTAEKTQKDKYFDLLDEVRKMRRDLLKMIIKDYEGEVWCISKHLLASSMRLIEVGTKYYSKGDKTQAKELFNKAYELYSLFWAINLKEVKLDKINKITEKQIDKTDNPQESFWTKVKNVVNKAIDCCKE